MVPSEEFFGSKSQSDLGIEPLNPKGLKQCLKDINIRKMKISRKSPELNKIESSSDSEDNRPELF